MGRALDDLGIRVLKILDKGFLGMNDVFDFTLSGGINNRMRLTGNAFKAFKRRSWQRRVALNAENQKREDKRRFTSLIYRLHTQGLITKNEKGMKSILSITRKGIEKFKVLEKRLDRDPQSAYPHGTPTHYTKTKRSTSTIVSFDIPEKEKGKRDWLRSVLRNLDYDILHESVWIGSVILPEDFLEECRHMDILKYIHIFSVIEKGTIKA